MLSTCMQFMDWTDKKKLVGEQALGRDMTGRTLLNFTESPLILLNVIP